MNVVLDRCRRYPILLVIPASLILIVTLAAVGILMVYSSSAMRAYLQKDDTFAIVGPQILWAALGIVAMVATMRVDYRLLRLIALPLYIAGIAALVLVFVPQLNVVVGGSARWLRIGPLPAFHPAEIMKLALVVYLALLGYAILFGEPWMVAFAALNAATIVWTQRHDLVRGPQLRTWVVTLLSRRGA